MYFVQATENKYNKSKIKSNPSGPPARTEITFLRILNHLTMQEAVLKKRFLLFCRFSINLIDKQHGRFW